MLLDRRNRIMTSAHHLTAIFFLAAISYGSFPALSETLPPESVRALAGRGDILALEEVLRRMQPPVDGEVIEVALKRENGRYLYKITALSSNGLYHEYLADAKTGASVKQ
jgi:hypothetical protein